MVILTIGLGVLFLIHKNNVPTEWVERPQGEAATKRPGTPRTMRGMPTLSPTADDRVPGVKRDSSSMPSAVADSRADPPDHGKAEGPPAGRAAGTALSKSDGSTIIVPLRRLSDRDQDYLRQPVLSDMTIISTETEPVAVRFSVRISPGESPVSIGNRLSVRISGGKSPVSVGEKAGLWFCFGTPTTTAIRSHLQDRLKEMKPSVRDDGKFTLLTNIGGPGFVAASCSELQQSANASDVWTGVIKPGLNVEEKTVVIPHSFGPTSFKATAMPVSLLLWDDNYVVSNELKVLIDLTKGRVVETSRAAERKTASPGPTKKTPEEKDDATAAFGFADVTALLRECGFDVPNGGVRVQESEFGTTVSYIYLGCKNEKTGVKLGLAVGSEDKNGFRPFELSANEEDGHRETLLDVIKKISPELSEAGQTCVQAFESNGEPCEKEVGRFRVNMTKGGCLNVTSMPAIDEALRH
jgi:hypothetical protein